LARSKRERVDLETGSLDSRPRYTWGYGHRPQRRVSISAESVAGSCRCMDEEAREGWAPVRVQDETFGVRIVWILSGLWTRPGCIQKVATREHAMPIQFRHDVDQVLKDAKAQQKPVLLDFSAAPM